MTLGAKVNGETVSALLSHMLDRALVPGGPRPTPVCLWGLHGIGKTELVRELARHRGCEFVYIAPAQFEEMGDLVGMPRIFDDPAAGPVTRFAPPEWAPRREGPGILLLDDVNRADDRILRGIMQLLQYYELVSWSLPLRWLIVLTANPDSGDYSVTAMDDAMLNRMLHVTMEFDVQAWARWAERTGVDSRGINFVLAYPELATGRRTTPRSLVQFFQAIESIESLRDNLSMIKLLGDASLDEETTQAFIQFVHLQLDRLPTPEDLLGFSDFEIWESRLYRLVYEGTVLRLDILSIFTTRLQNLLLNRPKELSGEEFDRLRRFILLDWLPNDLRLAMAQELVKSKRPGLQQLYQVPEIGQLLMRKM